MYYQVIKEEAKRKSRQKMYSAPKVRKNVFKTDEKKRTEEKALLGMDFPDLQLDPDPNGVTKTVACLKKETSYIDMVSKEKPEEEIQDNLEEGCCRLWWGDDRRLVIQKNEKEKEKEKERVASPKLSYHKEVSERMNSLFKKWDQYKENYIEMYGEDAYPSWVNSCVDEYTTDEYEEECIYPFEDEDETEV
jgi:hypothetical protein